MGGLALAHFRQFFLVVGSFGWLWAVLTDFRWLWLILGGCGKLWVILSTIVFSVGRFCVALGVCDWFWVAVSGFGLFWVVVDSCGWFWLIVGGFGWFWVVVCFITNADQLVSEPTHIPSNSSSRIDLIFTNQSNLLVN